MSYIDFDSVVLGNDAQIPIAKIGSGSLQIFNSNSVVLHNMLHTSNAVSNLIFINKLCCNNKAISSFMVKVDMACILFRALSKELLPILSHLQCLCFSSCLGHPSFPNVWEALKKYGVSSASLDSNSQSLFL